MKRGETGLSAAEKETVVRFDMSEPDIAHIYTCQRGIWLKLERGGYKADTVIRNSRKTVLSKEFTVPRRVISLRTGKARIRTTACLAERTRLLAV